MKRKEIAEVIEVKDQGNRFEVLCNNGAIYWLPNRHDVVPKVGDILKMSVVHFSLVASLNVNDECAFSISNEELVDSIQGLIDTVV